MSTPGPEKDDSQLTPEAMAVIGRARKSFIFSIGVLIVGFIAIGGALVYRATRSDGSAAPAGSGTVYSAAAVKVPAGAQILSAVASGGDISVTYKNGAATGLRIFDGRTGAIIREIPLVSE